VPEEGCVMESVILHQFINGDILKTSIVSEETGEIYVQELIIRPSFFFLDVVNAALDDAISIAEKSGYNVKQIDSPFINMRSEEKCREMTEIKRTENI